MKYEKKDDGTHVYVEGTEGEFEVLRVIIQASFDSAAPVGMGFLNFDKSQKFNRNDAEKLINKTDWDKPDAIVVNMDYVGGRQCKTFIRRVEKNHFVIGTRSFERDRGNIEVMLALVNPIIEKERKPGEKVDSSSMFIGEDLDKRLKEYGYMRNPNEDDWSFRKRIFPDLFAKCSGDPRAIEFLYGKVVAQWNDTESMLAMSVVIEPDYQNLKKFADGFAGDPLKMWPVTEKTEANY